MEEVDNIILDTLRALKCDIPEEITSLKQFDDGLIVSSISTCLETIIPSSKFPKKLSPSMALRLKTASFLAEQIKDIGFRDEIGYQTILYFNEVELRRVLIFLIEKLPRDSETSTQTEDVGYIPTLLREMKYNLRSFPNLWVHPDFLDRGVHLEDDKLEVRSYGNSCGLQIKKLKVPNNETEFKNYYARILPTVTKQCNPSELIPSLLYEDCKFTRKNKTMEDFLNSIPILKQIYDLPTENNMEKIENSQIETNVSKPSVTSISDYQEDSIETTTEALKNEIEQCTNLNKIVGEKETVLIKLIEAIKEKEKILQETTIQLDIKNKTAAILNQEDKIEKLQNIIVKAKLRLEEFSSQWESIQAPLLTEYETLKSSQTAKELSLKEKEDIVRTISNTYEELILDLRCKVELEQKLFEKYKKNPKNTHRSAYTKNILEIIGNIKKQDVEMQKILVDTKKVQKDINNLTGQIDRSFTLADEMIFSNAKKEETSKQAYKLLVSLHNECGEIVKIVSDIGFIDRECRNIQELIDIETAKEIPAKLQKLNEDLHLIRMENESLSSKQ